MKKIINDFVKKYEEIDINTLKENINSFDSVYHEKIIFIDPIHRTENLNDFKKYFFNTSKNLDYLKFEFTKELIGENNSYFEWNLHFINKSLNDGKQITTQGCSSIELAEDKSKIIQHRDYYDLNQMVYSHIKILKNVTKFINNKIAFK